MTRTTNAKVLLALVLSAAAASVTACGSATTEEASELAEATSGAAPTQELANGTVTTGSGSSTTPATAPGTPTSPTRPTAPGEGAKTGEAPAAPIAPADDASASAPLVQPAGPLSAERQVTAKLGLGTSFLIGLGNDASGNDANNVHAYGLGQKVDLHYMYLSGLDWPEWNLPAGDYVTQQANAAKSHGIVPMFTLYQAASYGENNLGAFNTTDFMTKYWRGVRIMFQKLGAFDSPVVVHVEPDLWGYTQAKSNSPSGVPMKVGALVPECTDLPADVSGMARCVIRLGRQLAPKAVIGLSASSFGAFTNGASDPAKIGAYMNSIGANQADITVIETLDRDAGCFENASDVNCKRSGQFYWDEQNVAHPNFHDHLAWAKTIRNTIGKPLLWWQMPLGVPANGSGYASHYRDNRVKYLFNHPAEFAAAGGIGAVFGTGAPRQTDSKTDNNQFKNAVSGYYASPAALP